MERTCQRCVLTRCPQADGRYFTCLRDECLQPGGSLCASGTHTALLLFVAAAVLRASLAACDAPASGRVHDENNQVGQVVLSTACDAARNSMFQRTHFYTFNDCGGSCSDAAKHQPMPAGPLVHCVFLHPVLHTTAASNAAASLAILRTCDAGRRAGNMATRSKGVAAPAERACRKAWPSAAGHIRRRRQHGYSACFHCCTGVY